MTSLLKVTLTVRTFTSIVPPILNIPLDNTSMPSEGSDVKQLQGSKPPLDQAPAYVIAGPSYTTQPPYTPAPVVYHYMNPMTHENVASLLPPNHPEMVCLQAGQHVPKTRYGILGAFLLFVLFCSLHCPSFPCTYLCCKYPGILAAVFWFPLGIGLCLLDRRVRCTRCGLHIDDGLCG